MNFKVKSSKLIIIAYLMWLLTATLIAIWWSHLLTIQADEIVSLQSKLGFDINVATEARNRTARMIFWESGFFFGILLLISLGTLWLYFRDQKRNRSIQGFFASLTHELRTPLASIRLQSETLLDKNYIQNSEKNHIKKIITDAERLHAQVERALELARIEGGGKLHTQALPLKNYFEQISSEFDSVRFDLKVDGAIVLADRHAMDIIVRNCIDNTLKHSLSSLPILTISGTPLDNETYMLTLSDNGKLPPLSKKQQSKLGSLFYRGEKSQGAGVGLYLIRSLMERMSGLAQFKSDPQFQVVLYFRLAKEKESK